MGSAKQSFFFCLFFLGGGIDGVGVEKDCWLSLREESIKTFIRLHNFL